MCQCQPLFVTFNKFLFTFLILSVILFMVIFMKNSEKVVHVTVKQAAEQQKKTFAKRLMLSRKSAGLTQQQLAEKAGIDRAIISRYEVGNAMPRAKTIEKLAAALNVPVALLDVSSPFPAYTRFEIDIDVLGKFSEYIHKDKIFEQYKIKAPGHPEIMLSLHDCDGIYEFCMAETDRVFKDVTEKYFIQLFINTAYAEHAKRNNDETTTD